MQARGGGRPVGTDGSDYAYRMTIDNRFKRAVQAKLLLRKYLAAQGTVLVFIALWALLYYGADAPTVMVASCVAGGAAVMIGTLGLKRSASRLLRIYIVATILAVLVCLVPVANGEMATDLRREWDRYSQTQDYRSFAVVLVQAVQVLLATLVQLFAVSATFSLIPHLSAKKAA